MTNNLILSPIPFNELQQFIRETFREEIKTLHASTAPQETEFITRLETARLLGISLPTLNDWTKRGLIPAYQIASRIRYKKEEVLQSVPKVPLLKYGRAV